MTKGHEYGIIQSKAKDRTAAAFSEKSKEGRFYDTPGESAFGQLLRKEVDLMAEITIMILEVIAILADIVTIYMFIESRMEKHNHRNEK